MNLRRRLCLVIAGAIACLPAAARAQSAPLADFVGTWVKVGEDSGAVTLILRPDSTFRFTGYYDYHEYRDPFQRWQYLRADTISFSSGGCTADGMGCFRQLPYEKVPYVLRRDGNQLTLTATESEYNMRVIGGTYTKVETLTATQTAQFAADLIGTWVGTWNNLPQYPTTLIVRADSTFARARGERFRHWAYLIGDALSFEGEQGYQATLQGNTLTLWNVNPARRTNSAYRDIYVYHRKAPR